MSPSCRADRAPSRRVVVVGTTGTGKTTVGAEVARRLQLSHVELDALYWEPGWVEAETPLFRERVSSALAAAPEGWVVDGNYLTKTEDLTWALADTVVFLDYPLPLVLVRVIRRTLRRALRQEQLWSGNRERLGSLFSGDSLVWWALRTHYPHRRHYLARARDPALTRLRFVHLRSPGATHRWLEDVGATGKETTHADAH